MRHPRSIDAIVSWPAALRAVQAICTLAVKPLLPRPSVTSPVQGGSPTPMP